jgi:hypothetical protein
MSHTSKFILPAVLIGVGATIVMHLRALQPQKRRF